MADRPPLKLAWYRLTQWIVGLPARLLLGVRVRGREHVPKSGSVVVLSNHQSHFDPPLIGCFCQRPLAIMARDNLFRGPLGWLIRSYDAIPIDRDGSGLGGIRATLKRLKQGSAVLMFPEGTRSPDGELQPLKPGFCALARRGKASIVPMAIAGAYQAWPRANKWPRPGRVAMIWGPPITAETIAELTDENLVEEVARRIADCFAEAKKLARVSE